MIPPAIREEIVRRIRAAERQHGVRVLFAIESGSRAWGFESTNSDFDARFIYASTPDWYLSVGLEEQRDVIEYPIVDDIDLNGWDVRKALRLFRKSNPAFVEWLQSPIVYVEHGDFAAQARALLPSVYSCTSGIHHYRSMARTNFRGYLKADLVPLKKYFYVLRPLLAVRWLQRYATPAPIEFQALLHLIDDQPELVADIAALLARKRQGLEMGLAPPVASIHRFIETEFDRLEALSMPGTQQRSDVSRLDSLFRDVLRQAWDEPASPTHCHKPAPRNV
jgi:predicted nucleotidyltransferase